jgi:DNA primase
LNRDDAKRRLLQSTDLVRLIGEQITLRPKGREFVALCPFHEDANPSMYVSPAKQIYKCFACGAGGDAFSFVMDYHKMTFPEAMKYLADREGIELPRASGAGGTGEASGGDDLRQRMRQANDHAARFYRRQIDADAGVPAREHLRRRGITDEMVEAFGIGYAPDQWDALARAVARHKLDRQAFVATGLIAERHDGSTYDRLRHRLVFPIFDAIGRAIAFGGRRLADSSLDDPTSEAKYLNSPETPLFNKSATLFGLHQAKKPIIDSRTAIIVEGYTDVIAAHQAGIRNVVATLGTALTRQHASELKRYCDQVIVVFDADEAGQKAADRALEVFFTEPVDVKIATLPEGSWGEEGDHRVWANEQVNWMWDIEYRCETTFGRLCGELPWRERDEVRELLEKAGRELLLLQASDWPFVIRRGQAIDYGIKRYMLHVSRFETLVDLAEKVALDSAYLGQLNEVEKHEIADADLHDVVFPTIDLNWWNA